MRKDFKAPGFKPGFRPQYSTYDKGGRVEKGKPHSTKKGRIASGIRKLVGEVKKK